MKYFATIVVFPALSSPSIKSRVSFSSLLSFFNSVKSPIVDRANFTRVTDASWFAQTTVMAEYSLPGVLHFLQSEWRTFERLKNEWQIEKSDLLAQVIVLNGEKANLEIINADLVKRVKMLEFALIKERYISKLMILMIGV